ncbi:MAG: hypothetical protein LQ346_008267 [Caloplaca aetnensis]|nr:MAG: hypothetical protein LQ346_008267 [Caloplaca aetnensis]
MGSEKNIFQLAAANVQLLDDPHEKKQQEEQILFLDRIPKAALASILSSWIYFGYSFKCLLDAQAGGLSGTPLTVAWLSFAMQMAHALPVGTPHLLALSAMGKAKRQPLLRLLGDTCPSVDVFITYCGEELAVLIDTVRAAAMVDYPKDSFRVIVLDDSVSTDVENEIGKLKSTFDNIHYSTRGSRPKTHTKAGNLNHGLKHVRTLPGGASDLVAVLDVDMIPSPHWLRALIPHIVVDPKTGMASPPQRHYNIPDGDPLGQTMDVLFDVMEPSKNATNAAWCCGTGFVVRRAALDDIGGVPEESISEDIMTSFYLATAGWKIVYVHEDVQWGLVPSTITAHLKQHKRLCAGIISTAAAARSPRLQKMTPEEKYGSLFPPFAYSTSVLFNTIILILMPVLIWTGAPLVAYATQSQLRTLSMLFLVKFLAVLSYDFLATRSANYHLGLLGISMAWVIPFLFVTMVRFALSIVTGGGVPLFTPSGLVDIRTIQGLGSRIKVALWTDGFIIHVAIIASLVAAVSVSASAASQATSDSGPWRQLFIRAAWPPIFLIWSTNLTDCWTPLSYTLSLPVPLDREALLIRDPKSQLAYPSEQAKDPVRVRPSQVSALVKIAYCTGICAMFILQK